MTSGNRITKACSLCLIGLGLAWIGCIAYRMTQDGLFPWQYSTVEIPIGVMPQTIQSPGWDAEPLDIPPGKNIKKQT
jgi:hypothetical protein